MQLVACQYDIQWEDPASNYQKVEELLENTGIESGALIALPEMFSTGFSMNIAKVAENSPSESERFLSRTAKRYGSWIMGGLVFEQDNGHGCNELAVFDPAGGLVGRYRKNYSFSLGGESDHYDAGSEFLIFDWQGFRVCPTICYDLRFPELYRRGVKEGANLFVDCACWPAARVEHWRTLLQARAIENQAVVMGVNRIGKDPNWAYAGNSLIIDHKGNVLADAGEQENCIKASITLQSVQAWREAFPALKDMKRHPTSS